MRVVAVGSRGFVSGFRLAGVEGMEASSPQDVLKIVSNLVSKRDVGLIILSDDLSQPIRERLTDIRAKSPIPLIYEIVAPGRKGEKIEYRNMLKQILGV